MSRKISYDASGFVLLTDIVPDVLLDIRYYSTYNFVGNRVDGYDEPVAILTKDAADALKRVSDKAIKLGYRLKIFDCYRPQRAVRHFARWARNIDDISMKPIFYPDVDKAKLFALGFIIENSGHTRGSTVDLTLFDMKTQKDIDMGSGFDFFGDISASEYTATLTEEQIKNRRLLRELMVGEGFCPLDGEWWHFTLENEPYTDVYFDFPVTAASIRRWYGFEGNL